jgi:hypothetical protein
MMGRAEHVARMGDMKNACSILVRNSEGKGNLEDLDVDGSTIVDQILGIQGEKMWTGCIWLRIEINGGLL